MLVASRHICEYGRQMALKFCFKTGFYSNFGRLIRSRGQMDPRTLHRGRKLRSFVKQKAPKKQKIWRPYSQICLLVTNI